MLHLCCMQEKAARNTRIVDVKWFQIHLGSDKRPKRTSFLLQCPVRNEDLSKTSAGVDGLPTPIPANKSLAAAATFGETDTIHRVQATEIISTRA